MADTDKSILSRRQWVKFAVPAAAVSAGSGLLAARALADNQPAAASDDKLSGARIYNVRDFGAKGDGATLDTVVVQSAVDACAKDQGGIVLVPAGVFVIGTVELKSNVTLRIAAGGKLLGSGDGKQYFASDAIPLQDGPGDHTMGDGNVGLIFAQNAENITIEGPGTIDGNGAQFRSATRGTPPPSGVGGHRRPYHLLFYQCKNLSVRDVFCVDGAYHSIRICLCTGVKLDAVRIYNRILGNNDGFHFISCQYVHVSNCDVQCGDDACALFGSCKFVTVTNSTFSTRWSVFRFGGGVAENIAVSNCIIYQDYGCPIKLRCASGSRYENMSFSNIIMNGVTGPISIGLGPQHPETDAPAPPGIVRNISFNGIRAVVTGPAPLPPYAATQNPGEKLACVTLNGMGEGFIENVSFNNVHITFPGGGTAEQAARRDIPKIAAEYYGIGVPPAYGLFARNVRGLTLNNVRFETATPDLRPAVVFDHVADAAIAGLNVQGLKDAESVLRFIGSKDVLMSATRLLTPATVFLQVEGANNADITIDGGDLTKADKALAFKDGAAETCVKLRG